MICSANAKSVSVNPENKLPINHLISIPKWKMFWCLQFIVVNTSVVVVAMMVSVWASCVKLY